jgi:hypothetical protein
MEAKSTQDMEALYRAAVGPKKADFYISKFVRFDRPGAWAIRHTVTAYV